MFIPPVPGFPEAGEFLRYWDVSAKRTKFLQIVDVRKPLVYDYRLGSVAQGATSNLAVLKDLNPSDRLSHRYMAYVGFRPGALFRIHHPFDFELLDFDARPSDVTFDMTRWLSYTMSPYDRPTFSMWIEPDRYPAVEAINVSEAALVPEVIFLIAKYRVKQESDTPGVDPSNVIDAQTLQQLQSLQIPSQPIWFGGDV